MMGVLVEFVVRRCRVPCLQWRQSMIWSSFKFPALEDASGMSFVTLALQYNHVWPVYEYGLVAGFY